MNRSQKWSHSQIRFQTPEPIKEVPCVGAVVGAEGPFSCCCTSAVCIPSISKISIAAAIACSAAYKRNCNSSLDGNISSIQECSTEVEIHRKKPAEIKQEGVAVSAVAGCSCAVSVSKGMHTYREANSLQTKTTKSRKVSGETK